MVVEHLKPDSEQETPPYDESARPIWEVLAEIGREIPDEECAQLPQDVSVNFRQHIHARRAADASWYNEIDDGGHVDFAQRGFKKGVPLR